MTHGGLGSLVEAIYHKAVIVGVPLRSVADPDNIILNLFVMRVIREWLQQRSEAKPAESSEARICRLLGLGRYDRFSIIFLIIKMTIPAEELVRSIKLAMEDKAMAANLERIHQIYMDR